MQANPNSGQQQQSPNDNNHHASQSGVQPSGLPGTGRGGRGGKFLNYRHQHDSSWSSYSRSISINYAENQHHENITLNQDLYYNMLEIFEQRNKVLLQKYPSYFIEDVLRHTAIQTTNYNFVKKSGSQNLTSQSDEFKTAKQSCNKSKHGYQAKSEHQESEWKNHEDKQGLKPDVNTPDYKTSHNPDDYLFYGYPQGNYLKIVCVILSIWNQLGRFPIKFYEIECLKEHDETDHNAQSFIKLTPLVNEIFKDLNQLNSGAQKSPRTLQKDICEFLCLLEPKGFLMCLGVRRTSFSESMVLPPEREDLEYLFNKPNIEYSEQELRTNPNPSLLTVGARALQKHASRKPNGGYWIDKETMNGMTERDKNDKAQTIMNRILGTCQWINIHTLHSSSTEVILEVRDRLGFGARWEIQGQFRGLIEPQQKYNKKQ